MTLMPGCRKGLHAHDWNEGELSRYCSSCWLVQPYPLPKFKGRKTRGVTKRLPPAPKKRPVRVIRSDPSPERRQQVIERDGLICRYCKRPVVETMDESRPDRLTIDHVTPKCLGGTNSLGNLVVACHACNCSKGDKMPDQFVVTPWGVPSKREIIRANNEAANRHQETHRRSDGEPKRAYERDEAFLVAQTLTQRAGRGAMDAFECPECGWWHVRIVPGLAVQLQGKRFRWFDDALIVERGVRVVGVMKGENMNARPGRHFRSRQQRIRSHWNGAERRAKKLAAVSSDPEAPENPVKQGRNEASEE